MATRRAGNLLRPFEPVGKKEIFLPSFVISLLRTPHLSPHYAKFRVPLNINKLDLKDYLYHAYGIQARHIRSHVVQRAVRQNSERETRPAMRRWYREISRKYMTVQMDRPFVWPAEPDDYSPWDRDIYEKANSAQSHEQNKMMPDASEAPPEDRKSLRQQAKRLLSGEEKWRSGAKDVRMFGRTIVAHTGKGQGVATLGESRPR